MKMMICDDKKIFLEVVYLAQAKKEDEEILGLLCAVVTMFALNILKIMLSPCAIR